MQITTQRRKIMRNLITFKKFVLGFLFLCFSNVAISQTPATPTVPNLLPYVIVDKLIFISGQLPMENGQVKFTGKLGDKVSEAQGQAAAQLAAQNVLAQLTAAVGSLDKVKRCVKLSGYVNATPDYTNHPAIINSASNTIIAALGENGKHSRIAIGVASLPMNAAVEVDAIFELK
jgi:enamine deaminase RidA (YjgF/YER057c/UK114 family)